MKKTTSTLLIVLILVVCAPLVGYFGTKALLLSLRDVDPPQETETVQPDEQSVEEPQQQDHESSEDGTTASTVTFTLPDQTLHAVQLASLSSESSAESFVREAQGKGLSATVMEKDGLYKVVHFAATGGDLSAMLAHAREVYPDAFMTTRTLTGRQAQVALDGVDNPEGVQQRIDAFFTAFARMSEPAGELLQGNRADFTALSDALETSIAADQDASGLAGEFDLLAQGAAALASRQYSEYESFNQDYLGLIDQILEMY